MVYSPDSIQHGKNIPLELESKFAELHCLTNYSFLKGASHPEEMVSQALANGYAGLAITDECSFAGIVKAWQEVKRNSDDTVKLVIGAEFNYQGECFVMLADTRHAYGEISRLISRCQQRSEKGTYQFVPDDLLRLTEGLLLWRPSSQATKEHYSDLIEHFKGRLWLLLELMLAEGDSIHQEKVSELASHHHLPVIASSYPHMHEPQRKTLQDTLTAIRLNQPVQSIKGQLKPNAENSIRSLRKLVAIYPEYTLLETLNVLNRCQFVLDELCYQYPEETVPVGYTAEAYLREQTYLGANKRYPNGVPDEVSKLIEKELKIIGELAYEHYFLTIYDIVQYARQQGILCQGRGSAANSAVCYCLKITEVDPKNGNLLFERFISKRRNQPPDIDVDFENSRREEVIQYIYQRYGRERCALAATVVTYRPKSALRDLGKALGLNMLQLENVIANYGWRYRGKNWLDEVISPELSRDSYLLTCLRSLLTQLLGFPRHLSQHVGGFIISKGPLIELVPIENAAMPERTVIQWDKDDLEALGLMKVDLLSLGMLTAIRKTLGYISQIENRPFTIESIPQKEEDKNVYGMLQKADSVGLFQVESRAQMNMLPRLKPANYYDLVVQVAIVRPGPIHGDMVHPYLRRKNDQEDKDVPLPELEPILGRTFGVPIFQEQVIAMAMVAGGFNADEAEDLRRSMASWKKQGHMGSLRHKLSNNLLEKGLSKEYVERVCRQIEGFGEYGFPESHAASFALLAYVTAWLKYYYPAGFCCGLLNSQPMGFYQPWQLIQDAQRHGVMVYPIDVNKSDWDHTLEKLPNEVITSDKVSCANRKDTGVGIRLGFRAVKGLCEESLTRLIQHRPVSGYASMAEVVERSAIARVQLEILGSANAFACFHKCRYQQRWEGSAKAYYFGLFQHQDQNNSSMREPSRIEDMLEEHANTGVMLGDHPMAYLRDQCVLEVCITAEELPDVKENEEIYVAGVVVNRQRPGTSAGVTFVTLEDETGSINVVVWLQTALKQMEELVKARLLKVYGKVEKDAGGVVIHIIAHRLFDITPELKRLEAKSRDYH